MTRLMATESITMLKEPLTKDSGWRTSRRGKDVKNGLMVLTMKEST
jgi:hypothetical protein